MKPKWSAVASSAFPLLLLSIVACSENGSGKSGNLSIPDATTVDEIPSGAPLIDQDKLTFIPDKLTVAPKTTVYLKNSESAVHTVTIQGKNVSGVMREGDTLAWIPPRAGSYRVTCDYHPKMVATITVE